MALQQLVPEGVEALDVADLGEALAVRRVHGTPELQWADVEVLPVPVQAVVGDQSRDQLGNPAPRRGMAEVQDQVFAVLARLSRLPLQEPLGVFAGDGSALQGTLRFHPEEELHPGGMGLVAEGFEAGGMVAAVDAPVAGLAPFALEDVGARLVRGPIPARVDPVAVVGQLLLLDQFELADMHGRG